jgi:hypothetical protein
MKIRLTLSIILILVMVTGEKLHSQDYKELTTCLRKWENVMKHYTDKMSNSKDLEKLSAYCIELADSVTIYSPRLKDMQEKYSDIDPDNAPDEVKVLFVDLEETTTKYSEMLSGLTLMVNNNSDNEVFQSAFGKLNSAIYNSRQ